MRARMRGVFEVGSPDADGRTPEAVRVWGRLAILFVGLVAIKLAMFWELGRHLHQVHWRLTAPNPGFFDVLGFLLLCALGVTAILRIGGSCRDLPLSSVRAANGWLVALCVVAVFLSFHEWESNWLLPWMRGVMGAADVWSYASLNLFFRPPFLAVWIAVYGLAYYLLLRTDRERSIPVVTALFFAAYYLLFLGHFINRGNDVWLLVCVGAFCVAGSGRSGHAMRALGLLAAFAAFVLTIVVMRGHERHLGSLPSYFVFLLSEAAALFLVSCWYARRGRYLEEWLRFAPFLFVAVIVMSGHHYPLAGNINNLLFLGGTMPRILIWELALVLALAVGLCWWSRRRTGGSLLWFDAVAFIALLVAVVDFKFLSTMGVRLDWGLITMSNSPKMIWRMALPYLPAATVAFVVAVGGYALAVRWVCVSKAAAFENLAVRRRSEWAPFVWPVAALAVMGTLRAPGDKTLGYGLSTMLATSPLGERVTNLRYDLPEFRSLSTELGIIPDRSLSRSAKGAGREEELSVFFIIMESTYNRHMSLFGSKDETMPLLSNYLDRMEIFPNFYCNFPTSHHARFSVFTGLLAPKENPFYVNPRIDAPSMFEILHGHGYTTASYDSCFLDYVRFRDFLAHRDMDVLYDCDTMPGRENYGTVSWGLREECPRDVIVAKFKEFGRSGERFVLSYQPVAPHYPYDTMDERFEKFDHWEGAIIGTDYTGRYKNQLLYMDWIIASMIDGLRDNGLLDRTLVVITNDHGEKLGDEKGRIGHGWSLEPGLSNIPLIVMDPRRPGHRVNYTLGSQIDVLPTILDLLGVPVPAGELMQGVSLFDEALNRDKVVRLSSLEQRGVIRGDRYILERPGDDGGAEVFRITHDGARTHFEKTDETESVTEELDRYEAFQDSFIRNYSYYKDLVRENE